MYTLPYFAVIFTSKQTAKPLGYDDMAKQMELLAQKQPGYLGLESAHSEIGITISYWENEAAMLAWKENMDHLGAQRMGQKQWYAWYKVRICKVEREYEFKKNS
jgi:heme-degrading monooxygenase HmoA